MSTPIRTWTVAKECTELQGLLSKTITRMPSTRKLSWEKCITMASWLARLVLSKKEHCSGEMQVSRAVCYPWARTVQCFSECSRRYSYHFQVFLWHALQDCFGTDLPHKPKSYKVTLCLTAALLGWLQIWEKVLQKFRICKDHKYVSVIYLLEHLLPSVFFQYKIFRGGDIVEYENLMVQVAVLFICWERRHYNKSILYFLSDMDCQRVFLPGYWPKNCSSSNHRKEGWNIPFIATWTQWCQVSTWNSKSNSFLWVLVSFQGGFCSL